MLIPDSLRREWQRTGHIPFRFYKMGYHFCKTLYGRVSLPSHIVGPGDVEMEGCSCNYIRRPLMSERIDRLVLIKDIVRKTAVKEACRGSGAWTKRLGA